MYRDSEIGVVFHHGVLSRSAFPLRLAQVVSVLFSLVYAALVTRFLLVYVQAGPSPFAQWVAKATNVVYLPLRSVFADGHDSAGHPVAWAILLVIAAGAVVQWSVVSWLREVARPKLELEED
jgi:putative effector of murein hydrolase LrgA (UPF0299 family)